MIEVGFGPGDLISRIAAVVTQGSVAGVDFSPEMVALCTKRFAALVQSGRVELRCAGAEDIPYDSGRFTKACTVNTVYFWSDPAGPLGELWRVLRMGGRLVVAFSPRATMEKIWVTKHGFTLYEPDEIRSLLEDAGFGDVEMIPDPGPRKEFICAIGTKKAQGAI